MIKIHPDHLVQAHHQNPFFDVALYPGPTGGRITWSSYRYPRKKYLAQCFSKDMFYSVLDLVNSIEDYHAVIYTPSQTR